MFEGTCWIFCWLTRALRCDVVDVVGHGKPGNVSAFEVATGSSPIF